MARVTLSNSAEYFLERGKSDNAPPISTKQKTCYMSQQRPRAGLFFYFERVCFISRCFAVYFAFLLTDRKRHAKRRSSLIWPDFGGIPLILDEYILPAHANGNNLRVFPEIFGKLAEPFRLSPNGTSSPFRYSPTSRNPLSLSKKIASSQ